MAITKPRILVVDNDPVTLKIIQKTLNKHDLCSKIKTCRSSEKALSTLIVEAFDILILDFDIDQMNGLELLKEARKVQRIDAAILITDIIELDVVLASMRMDLNDFIVKPLNLELLKLSINKVWNEIKLKWTVEENASKYENLINAIPDIVYKINSEGEIVFINNAVRSLGYEPKELLGKNINTIIHNDDIVAHTRKNVLGKYKNVITGAKNAPKLIDERRTGERMTKNLGIRLIPKKGGTTLVKDGALFSFGEISATGLIEKDIRASNFDSNIYSVGIIRDITYHKNEKEELRKERLKATHANQAKSDFLANMSHEIRTPMNGILGAANLLIEEKLSKGAKEYAEMILHSTKSLLTIINDILCLSKIESGKLDIENSYINLSRLTKDVFDILKHLAKDKQIQFELQHKLDQENDFLGDSTRIRQILINLVGNAIKFTNKGYVKINVIIKKQKDNMCLVTFNIIDTGIGITKEQKKRLFSRFTQANNSITRDFGGTGLGLAISLKLAELMGGNIKAKSEFGKGSTFTLNLPLQISQVDQNAEKMRIKNLKRNYRKHALIVEDNAINRKIGQKILSKLGITSEVAENGLVGITLAESKPFDLILMDLQMPLMDGLTATKQIKGEKGLNQSTPVFALTANVTPEYKAKCKKAGMDAFLTKPLSREDLINELDRFFD